MVGRWGCILCDDDGVIVVMVVTMAAKVAGGDGEAVIVG